MCVPLPQYSPRLLLEAVARLLAIPDGPGQGELTPHPVLADGSQGPPPKLLRLHVVRLEPQRLEFGVVVRGELVVLQDLVQLLEVASVEGHHGLGLQHRLVLVQVLAGGQRPQEAGQAVDVAALLKHLADAGHLLLSEAEGRQHGGAAARGRAHAGGGLVVEHGDVGELTCRCCRRRRCHPVVRAEN